MTSLTIYPATDPAAALVLAHGAGAGQQSAWMVNAAQALSERRISCFTFDFPYIAAGRKAPDRAPVLEASWREALEAARTEADVLPIFIGGKSMGGRIATHIAAQGVQGVRGVILLGYPLHPPGQPGKRRDAHLPGIKEPVLFVQGSNDTFGNEDEIAALVPMMQRARLHVIATGDHSLKVKGGTKAQRPAFDDAMDTVAGWMRSLT